MDLFSFLSRKEPDESPESYTSSVDPVKFLNDIRDAKTQEQIAPLQQQIVAMNDAQRVDFLHKLNDAAKKPQDSSLPTLEIQGLHSDKQWDRTLRNDRVEDLDVLRRTTTPSGETKLERIDLFDSTHEEIRAIDQAQVIHDAVTPYRMVLNSDIVKSRADFDDQPDVRDKTMLEQYWSNHQQLQEQMVAHISDPALKDEAIREFKEQSQISIAFYTSPSDEHHATIGDFDVPSSRPFSTDDHSLVVYPVGTQNSHDYSLDLPTPELKSRLTENRAAIIGSHTMEIRREENSDSARYRNQALAQYYRTKPAYGRTDNSYTSYEELSQLTAYPLNPYRQTSSVRLPIRGVAAENRNEFLFGTEKPIAGGQPRSSTGQQLEIPDNYVEPQANARVDSYDHKRSSSVSD